jgi:hypothetical protein
MGIRDAMLAQVGEFDASSISDAVGMPADRVEAAVAALCVASVQPGDTLKIASASSTISVERLSSVLGAIGGPEGLSRLAELMGYRKGKGSVWDSLSDLTGNLGA